AALARRHTEIVRQYVASLEQEPKPPYDFDTDPTGEVSWYEHGATFARAAPLKFVAETPDQFCDFVAQFVEAFRHNVEDQDGWQLLWYRDRPRTERIVQALFRSTVQHYCQ